MESFFGGKEGLSRTRLRKKRPDYVFLAIETDRIFMDQQRIRNTFPPTYRGKKSANYTSLATEMDRVSMDQQRIRNASYCFVDAADNGAGDVLHDSDSYTVDLSVEETLPPEHFVERAGHPSPLVDQDDVLQSIVQFAPHQAYLFVGGVSKRWRAAWGQRPK